MSNQPQDKPTAAFHNPLARVGRVLRHVDTFSSQDQTATAPHRRFGLISPHEPAFASTCRWSSATIGITGNPAHVEIDIAAFANPLRAPVAVASHSLSITMSSRLALGMAAAPVVILTALATLTPGALAHEHGEDKIPEGQTISSEPVVCILPWRWSIARRPPAARHNCMVADRCRTQYYGLTYFSKCLHLASFSQSAWSSE